MACVQAYGTEQRHFGATRCDFWAAHTPPVSGAYSPVSGAYSPVSAAYRGVSAAPYPPPYGTPSPPYQVQLGIWPHRILSEEPGVADVDDGDVGPHTGATGPTRILMDGSGDTEVRDLTLKSHSVTGGANLVYEYGTEAGGNPTKVYRWCFLRAGQAAKATQYDCRLPLRCTYKPGSGETAEALWIAVAASKGTSCKNRPMLWHPPTGTMKVLNSASPLCSIGGDAVTDAERNGAREALTVREKEGRTGVLGGRGKKRRHEEAAEHLPVSTRKGPKPTAVPAALAAPAPMGAADTDTLVASLADVLPDRIAGPLASGLEDHAVPIAKALASHVATPLAAALKAGLGRDLATAVRSILQQEARRDRDRLQARVDQLETALADSRSHAQRLADDNADLVRTRNAAQAAADTERAAATAARAELAAAQADVARLNERVDRLKESVDTWRDMVEREAQSRKGAPTQLTAGAAMLPSQESSQSSPPSAPSTPGPVTPQRCSPRKHGHK